MHNNSKPAKTNAESGNILLMILLAIVLIGGLTVVMQGGGDYTAALDRETLDIKISEAQRFASEVERGVNIILRNGKSEVDIRFSHPDADPRYGDISQDLDTSDQVFDKSGGAASYKPAPKGVNDGGKWQFIGTTAMPEVGTNAAELMAVLPNVNEAFCKTVNKVIGYQPDVEPADTGICFYTDGTDRFSDDFQFSVEPDTVNEESFTHRPSTQGCVQCSDGSRHYFYVLLSR